MLDPSKHLPLMHLSVNGWFVRDSGPHFFVKTFDRITAF